jgi:predicted SprT family Zn-dependent metalloprotease
MTGQTLVIQKIQELTEKFVVSFPKAPAPMIHVNYNLRGRSTAGTCRNITGNLFELTLHPRLLELLGEEYVNEVVTHEYCHAARHTAYPPDSIYGRRKPHGSYFYNVGNKLGVQLKRTTNLIDKAILMERNAATPVIKVETNRRIKKLASTTIEAVCTHCQKILTITKNRATRMEKGKIYYHNCGAMPLRKCLVLKSNI